MKPETRQKNYHLAVEHLHEETGGAFEIAPNQLAVPGPTKPIRGVTLTRLADIAAKPKPIRWLWPGHIPHGSMTLIIGDPGLGKSQLTLDLAARVSRGIPWPDSSPCDVGNVLLLASEDSLERTVMPRLIQAGADLDRIVSLDTVQHIGAKSRMFNLATDLDQLEAIVTNNHIEMIVIDPLNGYLGSTNAWKESEVRSVLGPACVMADRHDVALIGVMHLNKDNTRSAIHRVIGSVAFGAVTRSMFAVAPHPQYPSVRYFVSVKQNYTRHPATLAFVLSDGLTWDGREYSEVAADNLLAVAGPPEEKAERRTARAWLAATLENGPVKTRDIVKLAHDSAISDRALQRAKYDLKVQSQRHSDPSKLGGGYWEWRLPS